jgi:Rrf2 family nitric oxide-sensitive transcriptional repressor
MRLTDFTDYGLRVLIYAALNPDRHVTIREISAAFGISGNHVSKIVMVLGQTGYIRTSKGRYGGICLDRPATAISVGEVVRAIEPGFVLAECFQPEHNRCVISARCGLRKVLDSALSAYFGILNDYTLKDLIVEPEALRQLLGHEPGVYPLVQRSRR